jgi:peptide methionine sulfoxide reductase msrA/msrB
LHFLCSLFAIHAYFSYENKGRKLIADIELEGGISMRTILSIAGIMLLLILIVSQKGNSVQQEVKSDMLKDNITLKAATFAGGCFWCTEADFEKLPGVAKVISGYTGGHEKNPTYEEVSSGTTGHVEAVQVCYDPSKISYADLVEYFWKHIDPTDSGGQFVDRGGQYRSAIFYHDDEQKQIAEKSKEALEKTGRFNKPVATEIVAYGKFY